MRISIELLETISKFVEGKSIGDKFQIATELYKTERVSSNPNPPMKQTPFTVANIVIQRSVEGVIFIEIPDDLIEKWMR